MGSWIMEKLTKDIVIHSFMLTGSKQRHASHRKIMGAAFSTDAMESCLPSVVEIFTSHLERLSSSDAPLSGWHESKAMSLDVASRLLTGFDLDDESIEQIKENYKVVSGSNQTDCL